MIPWLDEGQVLELLRLVRFRRTEPVRRFLACVGMTLPPDFDLGLENWRSPFIRELEYRIAEEDVDDDESTATVPDLTRFCADVRNFEALHDLTRQLASEEDIDIGAEFGWED